MIESILISCVIIIIIIYICINKNNFVSIKGDNGNKQISVYNDKLTENKIKLLKKIIIKMYILKDYLVENKDTDDLKDYKVYINNLNTNFNKKRTLIYETDPTVDMTSYSVNKGEELSVCLTSKKTNELHRINLLMYVMIHEMAHFACPEIGHGSLFQYIFKKFTKVAIKIKIYDYDDYEANPVEYCGMFLDSSII